LADECRPLPGQKAGSIGAQTMICSLHSLFLSYRFLKRVFLFSKKEVSHMSQTSQTEDQRSLSLFYKGWDAYQQHLVAAIAPLTAEQLALRSSPENWSVGMIVTHIVAARVWWFHEKMGEGIADLASLVLWDNEICEEGVDPLHSAAELVDGLERSWQMIQDSLARWTPADIEQVIAIRSWTGEERPGRTRQWIIWHVLEHDIHHGGELSSILGAHGLAAVDWD
jgi:uncharacterized damage-inducible protein DinB